jgi:hypothetical protein
VLDAGLDDLLEAGVFDWARFGDAIVGSAVLRWDAKRFELAMMMIDSCGKVGVLLTAMAERKA